MARVLTPNVFITNNAKIAKDFFLNGSYINVEDLPDVPDALVISGKTNKYLQSLEYSVNFDNENNPSLTLEFVDTDGNFEQNMFMHLNNAIKSKLRSVFKDDGAKTTPVVTKSAGANTLVISDDPTRIGVRESDLTTLALEANNYNRIYIAFGTDNILSNWSDVLTFYLNKTTIDVSNGLRKYIFKFYASLESIFRPKLKFNFEDPNFKREFLYLDSVDKLIVTIRKNNDIDTLENVLYRLVKKYLSVITKTPDQNIIGILPALGELKVLRPGVVQNEVIDYASIQQYIDKLGIKEVNETQQFELITQRMKNLAGVSPNPAGPDATAEVNSSYSSIDSYMLVCNKEDSSINPAFPDFYDALNKINVGLKSILNTVDDFVIFQENNVKLLEYWRKKGLIADNKLDKCIVFGPQQMISEYLYRNYIPDAVGTATTFEQYLSLIQNSFTPTLRIYGDTDPLYSRDGDMETNVAEILLKPTYGPDLITLISKRKISSNFYEQINIDELSINNPQFANITDLFKTRGGLFELFEIPVFLNNFTNSNILNIQFTNSEVYLNGLKLAIDSNFSKAYLAQIANNANKVNIQGLNLSSVFDSYAFNLKTIIENFNNTFQIPNNVTIKEILKTVLVQQFYIAKDSGDELRGEYLAIEEFGDDIGGYSRGVRVERRNLFSQLKNVKPKFRVTGSAPRVGIGIPGINALLDDIYETQEEFEARVVRETGNKFFVTKEAVDQVLDLLKASGALKFDKLLYKHQGNINIDSLFLAIAASDTKSDSQRQLPIDIEKIKKNPIYNLPLELDIERVGIEEEKALSYFNLANTMFTIFDIKTLTENKDIPQGVVFKPKEFGLSQENIASELWNQLNSQQIKLNIKTLPFFHLSSFRLVNFKPCFVFSKQVTPVNINATDNSAKLDFFSGLYNIAAFKHVISTRECYSQFMLYKNIGNAYLF